MHRSNLSDSDSSINNCTHTNSASVEQNTASPTKRSSRIDSSTVQQQQLSNNSTSNLPNSSNAELHEDSFNIEEEDAAAAATATDDSEIDYDRKLLRQQLRFQQRVAAQQLQKDSELESLKNLLKNLEMLDKTNQLECLLSPRLNQKQKSASLSNHNKKTNPNMSNLYAKLESFDLVKAPSNILDEDYDHRPVNTTTATTTTTTTSSGFSENTNDPVRVIKITEIIEINNNNANVKALPQKSQRISNLNMNDSHFNTNNTLSHENNSDFKYNFSEGDVAGAKTGDVVYHVAKTSENDYRQLPILIEKLAKESMDSDGQKQTESTTVNSSSGSSNNPLRSNLSKNAEIVLEIINILDGAASKSRSNSPLLIDAGDLSNIAFEKIGHEAAGGGSRPKKITIRITGRTRSVSSDAKRNNANSSINVNKGQEQAAPVTACIREPIAIENVTGSNANTGKYSFVLNNNNNYNSNNNGNNCEGRVTSPMNTFKPILDSRVVETDETSNSQSVNGSDSAPVKKKEEEIKSDLNEIKFNLEKFKSYLTTLSESANNNFAYSENNNSNVNKTSSSGSNNVSSSQKQNSGNGNVTTSMSSMHTIVNR
jgi:hypothetical protein